MYWEIRLWTSYYNYCRWTIIWHHDTEFCGRQKDERFRICSPGSSILFMFSSFSSDINGTGTQGAPSRTLSSRLQVEARGNNVDKLRQQVEILDEFWCHHEDQSQRCSICGSYQHNTQVMWKYKKVAKRSSITEYQQTASKGPNGLLLFAFLCTLFPCIPLKSGITWK